MWLEAAAHPQKECPLPLPFQLWSATVKGWSSICVNKEHIRELITMIE